MANTKHGAVTLDEIVLDERCQPRAVLNAEAVQEYAELYAEGETKLPPLAVADVDGDLVLIDGFHRLAGARQADHQFVRVEVLERCDIGRAVWLAAAANQGHGVRRTNADKRQAVLIALKSDIGEEQSSRDVAAHVGVSKSFVNNVRAELEAGHDGQDNKTEPAPEPPPHEEEPQEPDMYHTAAKRIGSCYRKVCAILGQEDDVCEQLYRALEFAEQRELISSAFHGGG